MPTFPPLHVCFPSHIPSCLHQLHASHDTLQYQYELKHQLEELVSVIPLAVQIE